MSEYRLKFKYQGNIVIDAVSNNMRTELVLEGGSSDYETFYDYSLDPENPVENNAYVNRWAVSPDTETYNFARIPTELEINDDFIVDEDNGIRLRVTATVSGDSRNFTISSFQKFCGINENDQEVWTELWNMGAGSIGQNYDVGLGESAYLIVYYGNVKGNYGYPSVPSVGIQIRIQKTGSWINATDSLFWQDNVFIPIYDYSGSYEPTTGNITIGGRGDGSYPSDPAERPDVDRLNLFFSFGSANGKGLTYYSVLVSDVYSVFAKIYGNSYINLETRLKAMIDFFRIPFVSTTGSNIRVIPVADVEVDLGENHGMAPIATRFVEIDFDVFDLSNYGWDDFNDFKNTKATLYLPFHGRVNIDINAIARGSIEVVAVCDTYTGNVVYWVYTTSMQAPREILYGTYEGQSAVQIPIANTYTPNLMGKMMSGASMLGAGALGLATGNYAMSGGAAIGLLTSAADYKEQGIDRSHMQDSACAGNSPLHIRLDIERREMLRTDLYRQYAGIPAFTTQKLKDLEGFVKVHSADYNGLKCEQSEKEVIQSLMEEGIYL